MSAAKLYIDEDAAETSVIVALRQRGVDVLTVHEAGLQSASDEEQLRFASSIDRAIYSLNVSDFARLHREFLQRGDNHSGIILIPRQRYTIGEKIRELQQLLASVGPDNLKNTIHFL